jgi:ATP-dependent DNA ligase
MLARSGELMAADSFDDGPAPWAAVTGMGLEGVVAKRCTGLYRPGYRG